LSEISKVAYIDVGSPGVIDACVQTKAVESSIPDARDASNPPVPAPSNAGRIDINVRHPMVPYKDVDSVRISPHVEPSI